MILASATAFLLLAAAGSPPLEIVTVYARGALEDTTVAATSFVDQDQIAIEQPTHPNEVFRQVPGAWISRGSGQEHLTAIRSPVLTGAGACGAFQISEDGIPIRPAGFCNVNNLFEVNWRQAGRIEVLRGPGSVTQGSNALHGVINISSAAASDRPSSVRLGLGSDDYKQLSARWRDNKKIWSASVLLTDSGSFRDAESYDHALVSLRYDQPGSDAFTTLNAASLDQETAGFILGENSYRDPVLRRQNLNPEAYREGSAVRIASHRFKQLSENTRLKWTPYIRHSRMEFLQHFLPGKPLEKNGQESLGVQLELVRDVDDGIVQAGMDMEWMQGSLDEFQKDPTTGSAFLQATRPQGFHYDYELDGIMLAGFVQRQWQFGDGLWFLAGLRAEWQYYDYDNLMLDGNTRDDGSVCERGGCLYNRPADRDDDFFNVAPEFAVGGPVAENLSWHIRLARGFRPPQATELYRLQSGQDVADIDSEEIDSLEAGFSGSSRVNWTLTAFSARKRHFIFRDADGMNVSDGKTSHTGIEWTVDVPLNENWTTGSAGTWASHEYEFDRDAAQGESIQNGNDVDTAPALLGGFYLQWNPDGANRLRLDLDYMDSYYQNAANTTRYAGHELINFAWQRQLDSNWRLGLKLRNLADSRYAERADFAFGNHRYFPGAGRQVFLDISWQDN